MKTTNPLAISSISITSIALLVGCTTGTPEGRNALQAQKIEARIPHNQLALRSPSESPVETQRVEIRPSQTQPLQSGNTALNQTKSTTIQQVSHASTKALVTLGANDNLFEMVRNSQGPVLIDFYADWCGPCRKQGGILHDMENFASKSRASIIKINVDQHKDLASQFRVSSLPTLMLVKDGRIIERQTGVVDHQRIASLLRR